MVTIKLARKIPENKCIHYKRTNNKRETTQQNTPDRKKRKKSIKLYARLE